MHYVAIVTAVALLQFFWFGWQVGVARGKYGIAAPAVSGNEMFERVFRVHMNTLEQLVVFLPALWIFASFISPLWASILGAVFIVAAGLIAYFVWDFWAAAITVPLAGMLWFWYIRRWFMRRYVPSPGDLPTVELEASER